MQWYRLSAAQGYAVAQSDLGYMYFDGKGISQDYAEALKWYRLAANQGNAIAQTQLGDMYYQGLSVPQDYTEAMQWTRKAADQGYAVAQYGVGSMYERGQGVPKDYTEAVKWYRLAADQGNADAKTKLEAITKLMAFNQITDSDIYGHDLADMPMKGVTIAACQQACTDNPICKAYTFNKKFLACFLKDDGSRIFSNSNADAGYKIEIEAKLKRSLMTILEGIDLLGGDYRNLSGLEFGLCSDACEEETRCTAFTYERRHKQCWLKSSLPHASVSRFAISGFKQQR